MYNNVPLSYELSILLNDWSAFLKPLLIVLNWRDNLLKSAMSNLKLKDVVNFLKWNAFDFVEKEYRKKETVNIRFERRRKITRQKGETNRKERKIDTFIA